MPDFASRAGEKLNFALKEFELDINGLVCADLGSSTGGFVDCLLQNGAEKVYSVDTAYGELAWSLRNDPQVIVIERTNALHVELPEKVDFISIDVGWTPQFRILPKARDLLNPNGKIISLIKPHYEAEKKYLRSGKLLEEMIEPTLSQVLHQINEIPGLSFLKLIESPIAGNKGKNKEFLALIERVA